MTIEQLIFIILTLVTLGAALGVVNTRNLYYAALFLAGALAGMAGYFVLLGAGFLGAVQVVVYIGGIAILILFAIMLSRHIMTTDEPQANQQHLLAGIVAVVTLGVAGWIVTQANWPLSGANPSGDEISQMGISFLGGYLIPFMVVSILLLVALVGGIVLAREADEEME